MRKISSALLKKKLWILCKNIIRKKYGNSCYTCFRGNLEGSNLHTGHGKPKGALPLRFQYDLRNLRPQCYHCNINLGGCSDIFISKLEQEEDGSQFLKDACVQINGYWEIKKTPLLSGVQLYQFLNETMDEYERTLKSLG